MLADPDLVLQINQNYIETCELKCYFSSIGNDLKREVIIDVRFAV